MLQCRGSFVFFFLLQTKIISQNVSYDMVSYLNYVINPFNSNPLLFRDKNRVIHMEIEYLRLLKNRCVPTSVHS